MVVKIQLPDAKRSLVEPLSFISMRVDWRQEIEHGQGVKVSAGLNAEEPPRREDLSGAVGVSG